MLSTKEARERLTVQGFYQGLSYLDTLCLVYVKILDSQKENKCLA